MNWGSWILSAFVATLALTTTQTAGQGLGLTRMNLPYMLGAILTGDRDKARLFGLLFHIFIGGIFSIFYVLVFEATHLATWWFGLLLGLAHALGVLTTGMTLLPTIHPRMATERKGPKAIRQLEPPGFMALNYGYQTPVAIFLSHAVFGAILGALYHLR
jgi:hypothetical protein